MTDVTDLIFLAGGKGGNVAALIPDVILDVQHNFSNNISSYPIEKSQDGAYNVKRNNNRLIINGVFTESYIRYENEDNITREYLNPNAGTTPSVLPSTVNDETRTRRQEAFNRLEKAVENKEFLDIVTGLKTYEDCVIDSLVIKDDNKTQSVLLFSLSLVQPRFTTIAESVEVTIIEDKQDSASSTKAKSGDSQEVTEDTVEKVLEDAANALFANSGTGVTP